MKTWEITKTQYKISDFISWQRSGSLRMTPAFQRRSVWKPGQKSYLIDTIVRGLPIPIIFLRERQTDLDTFEPGREVVDGQQRLRTIISFIAPELLKDYDQNRDNFVISKTHNTELAGKNFRDLSALFRRKILDYQFSVHVLPSEVDDREVLQIFARMNSTGMKLNDQELRNAEFFGEFKTSAYEQAFRQLYRWRNWKLLTEDNIARMQEVELTSELYSMILRGITAKTQKAITALYEKYDKQFTERNEVETRFNRVMDAIDEELGNEISRSLFQKRTMFYTLFTIFYDITYGLNSELTPVRARSVSSEVTDIIGQAADSIANNQAPEPVLDATARRTTHSSSRTTLYEYFKGKLSDAK